MSAPNLTITVEPLEVGYVVYLPLAAKTADDEPKALLALTLRITNHEGHEVHLKKVTLSFTPPPAVRSISIAADCDISAAIPRKWTMDKTNRVILPFPAPQTLILRLSCDGYTDPAEFSLPLAAYQPPNGGYRFPAVVRLLHSSGFWAGTSGIHDGSPFALDMGVVRFDETTRQWTDLAPGTSGASNEDLLVWGQPICAMASGVVLEAINNVPGNPHPLDCGAPDFQQQLDQLEIDYWGGHTHGAAGNHFYIQHGDNVVLYAHLQEGTLNPDLLAPGSQVNAGDRLGLAGNSGRSTAPHLHLAARKGAGPESGPDRPLPFKECLVIDRSLATADHGAPWARVMNQGLPATPSVIWPALSWLETPKFHIELADLIALFVGSDEHWKLPLLDQPVAEIESQIRERVKDLSPAQRKLALRRLRTLRTSYLRVLERELGARQGPS